MNPVSPIIEVIKSLQWGRQRMKLILFTILCLEFLGLFALAQAQEFENQTPIKQVVFYVHGFNEVGEITFCDLEEIMKELYGDKILTVALKYSSKIIQESLDKDINIDERAVPEFAEEIAEQMREAYRENALDESIPFSFITHSQGGIVTLRYWLDCYHNDEPYCHGGYGKFPGSPLPFKVTNLNLYFNMVTPFWGSTTAFKLGFAGQILEYLPFIPIRQLRDLSVASAVISRNRMEIISKGDALFPASTSIVNVSGDMTKSALGALFKLGTETGENGLLEHDLVVSTITANLDFIFDYYDESGIHHHGITQNQSYYYPINGFHSPLEFGWLDLTKKFGGLACIKKENYEHETMYWLVRNHFDPLFGETRDQDRIAAELSNPDNFVIDLQTFNFELKFDLAKRTPNNPKTNWFKRGYFNREHIRVLSDDLCHLKNIEEHNAGETCLVDLLRNDSLLFNKFSGFNFENKETDESFTSYFHTGFFAPGSKAWTSDFRVDNSIQDTAKLRVLIDIPWFKPKEVEIDVAPAMSSFIATALETREEEILPYNLEGDEKFGSSAERGDEIRRVRYRKKNLFGRDKEREYFLVSAKHSDSKGKVQVVLFERDNDRHDLQELDLVVENLAIETWKQDLNLKPEFYELWDQELDRCWEGQYASLKKKPAEVLEVEEVAADEDFVGKVKRIVTEKLSFEEMTFDRSYYNSYHADEPLSLRRIYRLDATRIQDEDNPDPPKFRKNLKILGRLAQGEYDRETQLYSERDRVLVTNPAWHQFLNNYNTQVQPWFRAAQQTKMVWIDTKDIRLNDRCGRQRVWD